MSFKKLQVKELSSDLDRATTVNEAPLVAAASGEVRVKNLYAGVNATDVNMSAGRYFVDGKIPFDIGLEGCGIIDEVGEEVDFLKKGQAVLYMGTSGYSQYIYAKPEQLVLIPEAKPEFLATMVNGLTATIGLDESARIKAGEKVLITAAAGGTGQICVQWAKQKGCHVIGTTSSDDKAQFLQSIGCDHVINYRKEDLYETLRTSYPEGVDVIWETIGGEMRDKLVDKHLAIHGRMILVGQITGYKDGELQNFNTPGLPRKLMMKSQSVTGFLLFNEKARFKEYFGKLIPAVHTGSIKIKLDNGDKTPEGPFKGLANAARAVKHLHAAKNEGKVYIQL